MEKFTIKKKNGQGISCVMEVPQPFRGIVIVVHGFSSSMDCGTYQMLLRRLPAAGYGMLGIELPGHGTGESSRELLRIPGAVDSIETAERFVTERYPSAPVFYFASSFGAYLTGLYISTRTHKGKKAFFRSAAVNMPALFVKERQTQEDLAVRKELEEKGYFDTNAGLGRPVRITKEMFHDLEETDLFRLFHPRDTQVMMAHGEEDAVIDPAAARAFSEKFGVPLVMFPEEGHSLGSNPATPDRVADLAIRFFDE